MTNVPRIRQAGVAGLFYPRDPERLREAVDSLLSSRTRTGRAGVAGLVAPHAGYPYSGATAADAFACLDVGAATTVVIIGPSHVEPFNFTSVFPGDAYDTPLGTVRVDTDMAAAIAAASETIRLAPNGHHQPHLARAEHAIEVELPFLQYVCPDAAIVPIIMGDQGWRHCADLAGAIASAAHGGTVVVASSDLSHFHSDARAQELDGEFCRVLETGDAQALHEAVREGRCEACGIGPVTTMLLAAGSSIRCEVLSRTNSGAVTGDRSSVVGYSAAVVSNAGGTA